MKTSRQPAIQSHVQHVPNRFSIAEAKNRLPSIVHEVEDGRPVQLTRHGRPVAVLLSMREFERIANVQPDFWGAWMGVKRKIDNEGIAIAGDEFHAERDSLTGREFHW